MKVEVVRYRMRPLRASQRWLESRTNNAKLIARKHQFYENSIVNYKTEIPGTSIKSHTSSVIHYQKAVLLKLCNLPVWIRKSLSQDRTSIFSGFLKTSGMIFRDSLFGEADYTWEDHTYWIQLNFNIFNAETPAERISCSLIESFFE